MMFLTALNITVALLLFKIINEHHNMFHFLMGAILIYINIVCVLYNIKYFF